MYNSTEQFVLDKQFDLLEEKFDEVIVEGITSEKVGVLLKEAFNSEPYSLKELQIKGSEVNYIFTDENEEDFRLQFIGAGGAFGKNTDSVYIGKRRGNSKVFVDSIDKLSNPARIVSSMITYLNDYLLNKGKTKVGFAINLSGKAGVRFAPFLKKLIDRTLRSKLKVVKGNYDPINGRKFVWAYDSTKTPEEVFNGKKITDEAPWFKRDEVEDKATSGGTKEPVSKAVLKEINKYLQNEIDRQIKKSGSAVGVTTYIGGPVVDPRDSQKFKVAIVAKFDGGLTNTYSSIYQSSMDTSSQTYILGEVGKIVELSLAIHKKAKKSLDYTPAVNTRTEEITSDDSNKRFGTLGYVTNDMGSSLKVGETLNWFSFYSGKPEKFEVIAKTPEHVDLKSDISGKYFRYSISMWNPETEQKDLLGKAPQDKEGHTAPGLKPKEIEQPTQQTGFNSEIALEYKELNSMSLASLKEILVDVLGILSVKNVVGYNRKSAIERILQDRYSEKAVNDHFKAVDMSDEPTESKMDSKGQMKPFSISNLPPIVKGLLKTGIKTFTDTSTHPSNPDVHNWYFDAVGSTGKVTTEDNDSKLAVLSIEDKAIKSIEATIAFKFIPSLDPVDVIKAALDKTKVLVCGTTSQRDKMSLLSGLPKRSTNFTKTAKAIETYIQSRFKEAGIVAKIVPSGTGINIASVYIDDKYFHINLDYRMTEKLTTEIRSSNNPAVKIVHEDKIYDTPEQAHQAVFVKSIDKLIELISKGYTSVDEKPDISDNYSIEEAVASKDPSILGAKGLWMRGLLLNEAIEDVGFTFRWGMPKTGEMKTFISKGFVRNGKTLNAETAKGEVALFKVVGVDPKVTPSNFVSNTNDAMVGNSPDVVKKDSIITVEYELTGDSKWGTAALLKKGFEVHQRLSDYKVEYKATKDIGGYKTDIVINNGKIVQNSQGGVSLSGNSNKVKKSSYDLTRNDFIILDARQATDTNSLTRELREIGVSLVRHGFNNQKQYSVLKDVDYDKFLNVITNHSTTVASLQKSHVQTHTRYDNVVDGMEKEEIGKSGYIPKKLVDSLKLGEEFEWFDFYSGWNYKYKLISKDSGFVELEKIYTGELFKYVVTDIDYDLPKVERAILKISQTDSNGNKHFIHYNPNNGRVWMNNSSGTNFSLANLMYMRYDLNGYAEEKQVFIEGVQVADPSTKEEFVAIVREITKLGNQIQPF